MKDRLGLVGLAFSAACLLGIAGCSRGPARVALPKISASAAASAAMAKYDTDKDGFLNAKELEQCPALQSALKQIDTNNDGRVSADEIAARIAHWQESKQGLTSLAVKVSLDGQPLEGATVTLVPEEFLGSDVQKAVGVTDKGGVAGTTIEQPQTPGQRGVQPGFYRVEISKTAGGKETLPAKYNTKTTLGVEVAPDSPVVLSGAVFDLKSEETPSSSGG
jgi:hypothetical protein